MPETIHNPLIKSVPFSPDPYIIREGDFYYFCLSHGGKSLWLWRSPTLAGLDTTEDKKQVWTPPAEGPLSKEIWAPELHIIDGKWYIVTCADDGNNDNHRMFALESLTDDPFGPYGDPVKLQWEDEDFWAIDATYLRNEHDGKLYLVWAGWPGKVNGVQNIYIAPMSSPLTLSGPRVLISEPEFHWESWINEGPSVIHHEGKICIVFSANESWDEKYCLGVLYAEDTADLLDRASWTKKPEPILVADDEARAWGPGHNSFFMAKDGSEWITYHVKAGRESGWADRQAWVQPVRWDTEGLPFTGKPAPVVEYPE